MTLTFRCSVLACSVINVLWIVFNIIIISVRCVPFSKNWSFTEPGTCLPQIPIVAAVAGWGLAIELAIWSLPIPVSWRLQLPRSSKVALSLIFGLGILDIGVGIGRLVTILQVDEKDPTWSEVPALEWLAIEPSIAIIVACLMVCRPLMEKLGPASWRQSSRKNHVDEDHIKLVGRKLGHLSRNEATCDGSAAGSVIASRMEHDNPQGSAIHVRRDFDITADDRV
jgi:hypothetical protein